MKYHGVIFDFNGTLLFDTKFHNEAWQRMVKKLTGSDLDEELRIKMHGKNNREILQCIRNDFTEEELEYYSKEKEALYREICLENKESFHLVSGAENLFDYLLANQIPFTIASASIKDNIDFFVSSFNLEKWFDVSKIVYDDGTHKNKISMFKKASSLINVELKDCIIFEDSKTGIGYAKEIDSGLVIGVGNYDNFSVLKEYGADMCIEDFTKLDVKAK